MNIITDPNELRQVSNPISITENNHEAFDVTNKLVYHLTKQHEDALGLAAPQIGIFKRVFFARINPQSWQQGYVLFNPIFEHKSKAMSPSVEACLSLPGVRCCVERHSDVIVSAELIFLLDKTWNVSSVHSGENTKLSLRGFEAFIVQHEYDHLDGKLLSDLPVTKTYEERAQQRQNDRLKRIFAGRQKRKSQEKQKAFGQKISAQGKVMSKKMKQKEKKRKQKERKREAKVLEIQERYSAKQQGLL